MAGPAGDQLVDEGRTLQLSGGLLLLGFLVNAVFTMFHPSGSEDDHEAIFTEYADSGAWVAVHIGQFVGVLIALAGLFVLNRALRARGAAALAQLAAGAAVATAATWAILQGLDGVALKQAVDAWVDAAGPEEALRFGDAETIRWLEWGFQSYFRILFGLTVALFGAAILATRLVGSWLGWLALLAGAFSIVAGIDVGYSGLESGFGDVVIYAFQLAALFFAVGMLVVASRRRGPAAATR
jgi:hypothetical protein